MQSRRRHADGESNPSDGPNESEEGDDGENMQRTDQEMEDGDNSQRDSYGNYERADKFTKEGFLEVYQEQMEEIEKLERDAKKRNAALKSQLEIEQMKNIRLTQDQREQELNHEGIVFQYKLKLA